MWIVATLLLASIASVESLWIGTCTQKDATKVVPDTGCVEFYICRIFGTGINMDGTTKHYMHWEKNRCPIGLLWDQDSEVCNWPSVTVCSVVECENLIAPENGFINVGGRQEGARTSYTCEDGYQMKGTSNVRTCLSGFIWSGTAPTCELLVVECENLIAPENGFINVGSRQEGARTSYTCEDGYQMKGTSNVRTCLSGFIWSGTAPTCEHLVVECENLIAPENGFINVEGRQEGARTSYTCEDGYQMKGTSNVRTCLSGFIWSGTAPTCELLDDDVPADDTTDADDAMDSATDDETVVDGDTDDEKVNDGVTDDETVGGSVPADGKIDGSKGEVSNGTSDGSSVTKTDDSLPSRSSKVSKKSKKTKNAKESKKSKKSKKIKKSRNTKKSKHDKK